jgi:transcriptional regulator with XRE-family HTH domain
MKTIKEIRTDLGLHQSDIAIKINVSVPAYSLLENGQSVPSVEDIIFLERELGQMIDWSPNEKINPDSKKIILSSINTLSDRYPLSSVLTFVQKYIREGHVTGSPDKIIQFYTGVARLTKIKPLIAPDTKRTK